MFPQQLQNVIYTPTFPSVKRASVHIGIEGEKSHYCKSGKDGTNHCNMCQCQENFVFLLGGLCFLHGFHHLKPHLKPYLKVHWFFLCAFPWALATSALHTVTTQHVTLVWTISVGDPDLASLQCLHIFLKGWGCLWSRAMRPTVSGPFEKNDWSEISFPWTQISLREHNWSWIRETVTSIKSCSSCAICIS